jgi:hypothetical protein
MSMKAFRSRIPTATRGALAGLCLLLAGGVLHGQPVERLPQPRKEMAEGVAQPPTREAVFNHLDSDQVTREKIRQQYPEGPPPPEDVPPPAGEVYAPRQWKTALVEKIDPPYLCYGRLYFEQINAERYSWDLGLLHPFLSAGIFYWDVVTFPYHFGTEPLRRYECDAGYCLPGDPVPLLLYPPDLSLTGALTEAATIAGLIIIFPG